EVRRLVWLVPIRDPMVGIVLAEGGPELFEHDRGQVGHPVDARELLFPERLLDRVTRTLRAPGRAHDDHDERDGDKGNERHSRATTPTATKRIERCPKRACRQAGSRRERTRSGRSRSPNARKRRTRTAAIGSAVPGETKCRPRTRASK